MAVTISIPTALRQYAGGNGSITLAAGSVGQLLSRLVEQHPQLGKQLYSEQGQLRSFVNVYVGDEDIRYLQGADTAVWLAGQPAAALRGGAFYLDRRPRGTVRWPGTGTSREDRRRLRALVDRQAGLD